MLLIDNLSKTYANGVQALNNVSLTINAGMFGLLGPNGAGKSTLMRTLATLQLPDSGTVLFEGVDTLKQPHYLRPKLGYLPQEFGVYPSVTAVDLLDYFAILKGITDKKQRQQQIEQLLELTNLTQHKKHAVNGFSGGMKQRFGIAQALLGSPKLLIVDEPTAGLDPHERNRFHNVLSDISENTVVILSTHIVEDVSNLCPDMAILANGSIVQQGSPEQLVANLDGKLWQKTIEKQDIPTVKQKHQVISERLVAGKAQINVLSEQQPDSDFVLVKGDLEDAYFAQLQLLSSSNSSNQSLIAHC